MSIAEIRVRPGGWLGGNGRKDNKRPRRLWPAASPGKSAKALPNRTKSRAKAGSFNLLKLLVAFVRLAGWVVAGIIAILLVVAVSLGMIHGYRVLTGSSHFALNQVEITGNQQLSHGELFSQSGITLGESILEISLGRINARLLQNPWVESVTVRRVLPDGVSIHVQEREPFFWIQQAGVLQYADRSGNPIVPVELGRFVSLPILIVEDSASMDRAVFQEWIQAVERMEYPFGFPEIAWIRVEDASIVRVYLEDKAMEVSMDFSAQREHGRLMNLAWDDLRSRGELDRVGRMAVMGKKVWVQAKQAAQG